MPGAGKSTVGVLLAKALGYNFLDVDLLIQHREHALLQEILDTRGVEAFLAAEQRAVCSIACEKSVIATGGSAVCRAQAAQHLKSLGRVIYLRVSVEELSRRIKNMSTRGIAMGPNETLYDVLAQRAPLYEQCADLIIDCDSAQRQSDTAQHILNALGCPLAGI